MLLKHAVYSIQHDSMHYSKQLGSILALTLSPPAVDLIGTSHLHHTRQCCCCSPSSDDDMAVDDFQEIEALAELGVAAGASRA